MEQPFTAAPHHDLLALLLQLGVLLLTARVLGELAQRFGQPSVVGEILAGVLLGPSFLSGFVPTIGEWIIPHTPTQGYLLEVVSMIGVMLLLLITGLETDLPLIRRHARTAIGVSLGGILVTFISGLVIGLLLPEDLMVASAGRVVAAMLVAIGLAISSIPVIAKVLIDLNLTRRDVGQTIIAAAMSDDTIGWILLSIAVGMAGGAGITVGGVLQSVGVVVGFMLVSFTVGLILVRWSLNFVQDEFRSPYRIMTLVIVWMFLWSAVAMALNLEAVLGAFVVGILFSQMSRLPEESVHRIESFTFSIFAPIFFATAGLKVNVSHFLTEPRLILFALLVIVVASVTKISGTYLGARLIGRRNHWTALSFGAGLNARGAMGIIVATIGLSLQIITQDMFSILVVMSIVTSLVAPPSLRWVLKKVQPEEEELRRLEKEALIKDNVIARAHRVLLPVRVQPEITPTQALEARILEKIGAGTGLAVTLFTVISKGQEQVAQNYLNQLSQLFSAHIVTIKAVIGDSPADLILDEAAKDYDLIILGASEKVQNAQSLFNPVVDYIMRLAPCPTIVAHGSPGDEAWTPRRVLVPTNGSLASKRAAEVGFALASEDEDYSVITLSVVRTRRASMYAGEVAQRQLDMSEHFVNDIRLMGQSYGVQTTAQVEVGDYPETEIIESANDHNVDLIILGVDVRAGGENLYMGRKVEYIIGHAACPVLVVNA